MYELLAGERLVPETAVPVGRGRERPILVSAVPVGPGTNIGRSCMFLGSLIRVLRGLPGGLGSVFALWYWGLITVVCGMLVGKNVVMALHLGPGRPLGLSF